MISPPNPSRYDHPDFYARCGKSGLFLPKISLGLWHNFGHPSPIERQRDLILAAFDIGITHFDIANNYGPPGGAAEENFGRILKEGLGRYRDELVISTKAGWRMWPGPYGERCSRKSLLASLDQSLRRLGLEYVDIYYLHRFDDISPMDESAAALEHAIRSGKVLYAGISGFSPAQTTTFSGLLHGLGTPLLIHQPCYHMFDRTIENGLLDTLGGAGIGCVVFCPLAQGLLSSRYLANIPSDSRAANPRGNLKSERVTPEALGILHDLNSVARDRGQTLSQLALTWVLRDPRITSALTGASKVEQIVENMLALDAPPLEEEELAKIETILSRPGKPSIW